MSKKVNFAMRLSDNEKWALEQFAQERDMSLRSLMVQGALFLSNFPPEFLDEMERASKMLGVDKHALIVSTCLRWAASSKAWLNVFGSQPPGLMRQFRHEGGKMVTGGELLERLEEEFTDLFEQFQRAAIKEKKRGFPVRISKEQAFEVVTQL